MNDLPNIINTQIVNSEWDRFWSDASDISKTYEPRSVLVISQPFAAGSAEEIQLQKMLQACKLTSADYHVIQLEEGQVIAWHALRDALQVKTVILLGITPDTLGVNIQLIPHQVARFNNCNWIPTSNLQELMQYAEIKTHVWNYGLKPVFIDKIYG